ncbi:MFS transporter [Streptomyces sp. NPDC127033]|uniref:MFS transporter n=1 Tax=Streptomyces sp. NPDC127033 TaxID=3347110 RepID=UPI00365E6D5E
MPIGTLLANAVFLLVATHTDTAQLLAWGWRIPFLVSAVLVAVGIYIRLHIEETSTFQAVRETGTKARIPFFDLMRRYWRQVLLGGVATLSTGSTFTLMITSGVSYGAQELGHSKNLMLGVAMAACALAFVCIPLFGHLSDRFGRKPVIYAGIAAEALLAFPFFWLLDTGSAPLAFVAYGLMAVAFSANYGPIATFLAELFGTRVRYSGLSVAYMLSGLLGSAATPAITVWLLSLTGDSSSIAWYILTAALVSLAALFLLSETRFGGMEEEDTASATPDEETAA